MRFEKIRIDLYEEQHSPTTVLKQYDDTRLIIELYANFKPFKLDGKELKYLFNRSDGSIIKDNILNIKENIAEFDLDEKCLQLDGLSQLEILIYQDKKMISSFIINIDIEKSNINNIEAIDKGCYLKDVDKALEKVEEGINEIEDFKKLVLDNIVATKKIIVVSKSIQAETEYTLPCNYKVGNHSLRVHWENVLLEEGENGNYMEVGDKDSISNKIKFGWDIEAGETLIIEVRGVENE